MMAFLWLPLKATQQGAPSQKRRAKNIGGGEGQLPFSGLQHQIGGRIACHFGSDMGMGAQVPRGYTVDQYSLRSRSFVLLVETSNVFSNFPTNGHPMKTDLFITLIES